MDLVGSGCHLRAFYRFFRTKSDFAVMAPVVPLLTCLVKLASEKTQ